MKIRIYCFFLVLLLIACKQKDSTEYYPNGNIKSITSLENQVAHGLFTDYYENGNLRSEVIYVDGLKNGLSTLYYPSENKYSTSEILWKNDSAYYQKNYDVGRRLVNEGSVFQYDQRIGKWNFYDQKESLSEVKEFINVKDGSYLNQHWILNDKKDTIGGNYYKLKLTPIDSNRTIRFHFLLKRPLLLNNSELFVCLPKDKNLKEDFSNENKIKWDTIDNMARRFKDQSKYLNRNYDVIFDIDVKDLKVKPLKGYLLESQKVEKDSFDTVTRKIYFNIPYDRLANTKINY